MINLPLVPNKLPLGIGGQYPTFLNMTEIPVLNAMPSEDGVTDTHGLLYPTNGNISPVSTSTNSLFVVKTIIDSIPPTLPIILLFFNFLSNSAKHIAYQCHNRSNDFRHREILHSNTSFQNFISF